MIDHGEGATDDRLLGTLERLLEIEATSVDDALDQVTRLVAETRSGGAPRGAGNRHAGVTLRDSPHARAGHGWPRDSRARHPH